MASKFEQMGYLYSDNRASGGGLQEADLWCCSHCQKVLIRQHWTHDGGFCGRCMQPVCGVCADLLVHEGCVPFIQQVEEALDRAYHRAQNMKMLGIGG